MKKLIAALYVLFICIFVMEKPAHAYIDPGVGSMLLQGLAAALISGLVFFRRFRDALFGIFSKKDQNSEQNTADVNNTTSTPGADASSTGSNTKDKE